MDNIIKRVRILKLWEILTSETDEEHPIATEDLLDKLAGVGIQCVRTTLYEDIKTLRQYGYEIFTVRAKTNLYYVEEGSLSVTEVLILMDAVQAAGFITERKTEELLDKLSRLTGGKRSEALKRNVVQFTIAKTCNEKVLYYVNEISQAIANHKKIRFNYFYYDLSHARVYRMSKREPEKRRVYKVNPLGTVFDNGYYYLFCYDDYFKGVSHYRIDRMDSVQILEEDATDGLEKEKAALSERKRRLFFMYGGAEERLRLHADKELLDVMYDKFGGDIQLYDLNEKQFGFCVNVQVSPTFLGWCCSFGNKLRVVSPQSVVEQIKEYVEELHANYRDEKSSP